MKNFLLVFVFMLSAFAMQAQYVAPSDAILILNTEATAIQNGSSDVKDLASTVNGSTSGTTITATTGSSTGDISLNTIATYVYPGVMTQTAKEIELAGDTAAGIHNAEAFFAAMSAGSNREDVLAAAFAYVKDLLTI